MKRLFQTACLWSLLLPLACNGKGAPPPEETIDPQSVLQPEVTVHLQSEKLYSILEPQALIDLTLPTSVQLVSEIPKEGKCYRKGEVLFIFSTESMDWQLEQTEDSLSVLAERKKVLERKWADSKNQAKKFLMNLANQELALSIKQKEKEELLHQQEQNAQLIAVGGLPASENHHVSQALEILSVEIEMEQNQFKIAQLGIQAKDLFPNPDEVSPETLEAKQIEVLTRDEHDALTALNSEIELLNKEKRQLLLQKAKLTVRAPEEGFVEQIKIARWEWSRPNQSLAKFSVQSTLKARLTTRKANQSYLPIGSRLPIVLENNARTDEKPGATAPHGGPASHADNTAATAADNGAACMGPKSRSGNTAANAPDPDAFGTVVAHSATVNPATGEFAFEITVDNFNYRLCPGEPFQSEIIFSKQRCWKIPLTALLKGENQNEIICIHNGCAVRLPVRGDLAEDSGFLIFNPPEKSYPILNYPSPSIRSGKKLSLPPEVSHALSVH